MTSSLIILVLFLLRNVLSWKWYIAGSKGIDAVYPAREQIRARLNLSATVEIVLEEYLQEDYRNLYGVFSVKTEPIFYVSARCDRDPTSKEEHEVGNLGYMAPLSEMEKQDRAFLASNFERSPNPESAYSRQIQTSRGYSSIDAAKYFLDCDRDVWTSGPKVQEDSKLSKMLDAFLDHLGTDRRPEYGNDPSFDVESDYRYSNGIEVFHYVVFKLVDGDGVEPTKYLFQCFKRPCLSFKQAIKRSVNTKFRYIMIGQYNAKFVSSRCVAEDEAMRFHKQKHLPKWVTLNRLDDNDKLRLIARDSAHHLNFQERKGKHLTPTSISVSLNPGAQPTIYMICKTSPGLPDYTFHQIDLRLKLFPTFMSKDIPQLKIPREFVYENLNASSKTRYSSELIAELVVNSWITAAKPTEYTGRFGPETIYNIPRNNASSPLPHPPEQPIAEAPAVNFHRFSAYKIRREFFDDVVHAVSKSLKLPSERVTVVRVSMEETKMEINGRNITSAAIYVILEIALSQPQANLGFENLMEQAEIGYIFVEVSIWGEILELDATVGLNETHREINVTGHAVVYIPSLSDAERENQCSLVAPRWEMDLNIYRLFVNADLKETNRSKPLGYNTLQIAILAADEWAINKDDVKKLQKTFRKAKRAGRPVELNAPSTPPNLERKESSRNLNLQEAIQNSLNYQSGDIPSNSSSTSSGKTRVLYSALDTIPNVRK